MMKRLTGIRLVNWHAFKDETIEIKNSTLLSGENGAGKSTILDAIQFVLTCSKNNFNKAANENSKRSLSGYVRFKTGREDNEFERSGDVSAHVALEFYEESKKNYFIIGAVIDSASETSEKILWYRLEKCRFEDVTFIVNNEPADIANFRLYGKELNMTFSSTRIVDAKKDFSHRLGRLNEKFFELLPKALAFKPISNVKEFVYTYILEEKSVNIDELRENIRTFKEFEDILNEVKVKIKKLEEIEVKYSSYESISRTISLHEFIVLKAEEELLKEEIEQKVKEITALNVNIDTLINKNNVIYDEITYKTKIANNIQADLYSNSEYKALETMKNSLEQAEKDYRHEKEDKDHFLKQLSEQKSYIKELSRLLLDTDTIGDFYNKMISLDENSIEEYKTTSINTENVIDKTKQDKEKYRAGNEYELKQKEDNRKDIEKQISELEKRNLQYPKEVILLKEEIIKETRKLGREIVPKILCELLEVTDPVWKNAVEGYLNTQRFYLIVDEEDFDSVLKIYERLSKAQGLHSVGVINTGGLAKYDNPLENSLAEVVVSKSTDAKRYINMILGNVIRCTNVSELKEHKTSITPTCMMYKNNVARAINPKIYKTPYIGEDAYKYQLEQAKANLNILLSEINVLKENISIVTNIIKIINKLKLENLREKCAVLKRIVDISNKVSTLKEEIFELEKNNSYMALQIKLNEVQEEIESLNLSKKKIENELINKKGNLSSINNIIDDKRRILSIKKVQVEENKNKIGSLAKEAEERFIKETESKSFEIIKNNFNVSKEGNKTKLSKTEEDLKNLQGSYNITYDFGAEVGINGINTFLDELDNLVKSKVIEYEEQVKTSRKNAEEEFKEHFLSKIQENINTAKSEFKGLNKGLKDVKFGNEEYEFKIGKSKENKEYYDMIMDNENIGEGFTLFSTSYENKHKELLNELFDKLTLDNESNEAELIKLTDYRNYMSYDIEIKYNDNTTSLFSKVCREKSGGETQTPFYVAMAASFLQLYKGVSSSSESIGIILFDEAFDKMDDARIMSMMEFYDKFNSQLQLLIGAPPQKIEPITPYVNTVLLAIKADKFSIIEDMINEKL
ncbi:ATP-binding protein [Clostridium beijerinckii]|uniref:ATP-binding protein n=1 Tax=Clostridium beijerinckii TaxID=1520 RepID=UPI002432C59C|nr:SbcC/MukB-like Walker B domain-containing protein [Clostridium beijerinckii]MDG5853149.1 SbcC/MukB-like Walker B domain-containing protein [Clostridium beijerinckii]